MSSAESVLQLIANNDVEFVIFRFEFQMYYSV
jgi:hypothetical protein